MAVLASALPFLILAQQHETAIVVDSCSVNTVLKEKKKIVLMPLFAVFLLPLLFTNILYVYLMFRLRQQKRQQEL